MKQVFVIVLTGIILFFNVSAQDKMLTMRDAVVGQYSYLYPEYMAQLKWRDNTSFTYIDSRGLIQKTVSGKESVLLTVEDINKYDESFQFKYLPKYDWDGPTIVQLESGRHFFGINMETKKIVYRFLLPDNTANLFFNSVSQTVAYTIENNLYIQRTTGDPIKVTKDNNPGIVNGQEVHRREFGIDRGIFWSSNGKLLAFYRKDETMVSDYPLVDITQRVAEVENIKYPMAGMKSHHVTLGVFNPETNSTVFMNTGEPAEQYLTAITWDPDEKHIYIGLLNRDQNHLKMNKYNALTGEFVATLFEETDEKYVEPEHPLLFLKKSPDKFIWQSKRDGFNHLYLYDTSGKLIRQLTKGDWIVTDVIGFDAAEKYLYYESTEASPIERNAYRLDIAKAASIRITNERGTHNVHLSPDGKYLTDAYSNTDVPKVINLIDGSGKVKSNLLTSINPMAEFKMPAMEMFKIKAADGATDLYGRLIKPIDFDPGKKYPAIIYVYGGPHAQLVEDSWLGGAQLWQFLMAQKGYVMLTVDGRGSFGRGQAFENVIHRDLGNHEVADQVKAWEYLRDLGYVDLDRVGVHGWSYGGFMTTNMMLDHPDKFKVGVAGGPVIDWNYYEIMYGERYMDTPQDNPEGYEKAKLTNRVDKLEGRLMLIHGAIDPVVVWQNSLVFIRECVKAGKMVDYFVYPRHEHNVQGMDRIHLMDKVTLYFEDFL